MSNVITMALKDLLLLWRDKASVFWILLFPLVFALFFGTLFGGFGDGGGGSGSMRIAVVDRDGTDGSRRFAELLDSRDAISVVGPSDGEAWTKEDARGAVLRGDVLAYLVIPEGFGGAGGMTMFMGDTPELEMGVDPSRSAEKSMLEGLLMEASFRRLQDSFANFDVMREDLDTMQEMVVQDESLSPLWRGSLTALFGALDNFADMAEEADAAEAEAGGEAEEAGEGFDFAPIQIRHEDVLGEARARPISAFEISFPQSIVWGIIGCTAGLAMMLVQEKTRGTWIRLRLAPQSQGHILASKGLACFLACCVTIGFLLLVGHLLLGVRVHSWLSFVLAVSCSSVCFTGLMMIFATLGNTEQSVAGWAWGGMMPMAMLGGGMVPLMMMPGWMQTLSNISPVKWAVYSMEGAIWRGLSVGEMLVPCLVLVLIGAAGYGVGVVFLTREEA